MRLRAWCWKGRPCRARLFPNASQAGRDGRERALAAGPATSRFLSGKGPVEGLLCKGPCGILWPSAGGAPSRLIPLLRPYVKTLLSSFGIEWIPRSESRGTCWSGALACFPLWPFPLENPTGKVTVKREERKVLFHGTPNQGGLERRLAKEALLSSVLPPPPRAACLYGSLLVGLTFPGAEPAGFLWAEVEGLFLRMVFFPLCLLVGRG